MPERHYMVDISDRVAQVRAMIERGDYFCINRARQFGKTTLLAALRRALSGVFAVASLDFQALSHASFHTEGHFVRAICRMVLRAPDIPALPPSTAAEVTALARESAENLALNDLFFALETWCAENSHPIVLLIDEVDSATNNQVFLDFLAQLRLQYLRHEEDSSYPAFQSVVLAGVTDVRHLKAKTRPEDQHKVNSPWNIAADFNVRMSFDETDVAGMLAGYEAEHTTGMDVAAVAHEVVAWTSGYPFLVSRVCQLVDRDGLPWNRKGVDAAIRQILSERNTLFESLTGKLEAYPQLKATLRRVLMEGERLPYSTLQDDIAQLEMYGFVARGQGNQVTVANRIFETLLYDLFILEDKLAGSDVYEGGELGRSRFVRSGHLDMREILEGFRQTYTEVFGPLTERFPEKDGRELFLLYLKPIINGTGNYYIEAQTRDRTRTDVIVDYAGERFVIELKVWRGQSRHEEGEEQLKGYLEHFGLDVGYMLSFNFNQKKEPGLKRVTIDGKVLWEETL